MLPPALPCSDIICVVPNLFQVTGTARFFRGFTIPRNMVIIRHGDELSLVNAVRLPENSLKELEKLGRITRLIRIGAFHGSDEAFYQQRYENVQLWALENHEMRFGAKITHLLRENQPLPFLPDGCAVFVFRTVHKHPEAALFLEPYQRTLVTCDSVQNMTDVNGFGWTLLGKILMKVFGFGGPAALGLGWIDFNRDDRCEPLSKDFERLVQNVPFENLVTAHGYPITDGTARRQLADSVRDFSERGLLTGKVN